ncbi:antagonist of mitotic exit network protein 1 [Trichomonascus vanleenenianus]|uniref:Amn1p n=1 Tax=Trichomonascus vanleenenianus TaxID=2268995 RepID=UPI003ECB3F78
MDNAKELDYGKGSCRTQSVRRSVSVPQSLLALIKSPTDRSKSISVKKRGLNGRRNPFLNFIRSVSSSASLSPEAEHHHYHSGSISSIEEEIGIPSNASLHEDSPEPAVLVQSHVQEENEIDQLCRGLALSHLENWRSCHPVLTIPEIMTMVMEYVDDANTVPHEQTPRRRKPMSLRHALLLYGDTPSAREAWESAQEQPDEQVFEQRRQTNGLHSCLLVNQQWNAIATRVLFRKLYFKDNSSWNRFIAMREQEEKNRDTLASNTTPRDVRLGLLVLHKVTATQRQVELLDKFGGNLSWIEFYTCANIVPTRALLSGNKLTKIVLPGCTKVNDRTVALIAECCRSLEHLDLRACEQVSDKGIRCIAKYCPKLKLLNVGRTRRGALVTSKSIKHIVRRTNIETLGLAGCHIDDRTIWDLARYRGPYIERLSLNNCYLLTNNSIPRILGYTPHLSVLELRGCTQITDMRPIVLFKRYRERMGRPPLIEGCEIFELRMKEAEWLLEMEISRRMFRDCLEWIYGPDDDVSMEEAGLCNRVKELKASHEKHRIEIDLS